MSTIVDASPAPTRSRRPRLLVAAIGAALAVVGIVAYLGLRGTETTEVPYDDPAATGTLALCDAAGNEVTEGSVSDAPFAAVVAGSTAAATGYDVDGRVATLYAYQPREAVTAGEFSGSQLAASSTYTDVARPAAALTDASTTLEDFLVAYPATLDGFVQLRLVLSAPGYPPQVGSYDTADLQVDGDTWRLVRGGGSCAGVATTATNTVSTP